MDKLEFLDKLREYYSDNILDENYLPKVELLASYSDEELQELFKNNDIVSDYLENFLLKCYDAKFQLETLKDKELGEIENLAKSEEFQDLFDAEMDYLQALAGIADIFTSLDIDSKAKKRYESFLNIEKYSKLLKNEIKYNKIHSDNEKLIQEIENYKYIIFENVSANLLEMKEEFFESCVTCYENYDLASLNEIIIEYVEDKKDLENLLILPLTTACYNCIYLMDSINQNLKAKEYYNNFVKSVKMYNLYSKEIINNSMNFLNDEYIYLTKLR